MKCIPPAPLGLTAGDGALCGTVRLTWNSVEDAATYEVWRNTADDPATAMELATGLSMTTFDDGTAAADAMFFYWVTAVGGTGASEFSITDAGFNRRQEPAAPSGVAATENTVCGGAVISWEDVAIASSYEVWRQAVDDPNPAIRIAAGVLSTTFTDTTAAMGTTFFYWARSVNTCGAGDFSETVIGSTATAAPSVPTGLSATDGTVCGSVRLSWNPADGTASYQVWRSTTDDPASAVQVETVATPFFTDSESSTGVSFFYWIAAANGCGVSGFSTPDRGAAGLGLPDCPDPSAAPSPAITDCADGLCATGTGTVMPIMLVGCWFIRKKNRSHHRPRH